MQLQMIFTAFGFMCKLISVIRFYLSHDLFNCFLFVCLNLSGTSKG